MRWSERLSSVATTYLDRACRKLGIDKSAVLSSKFYPERGEFALVVDRGIWGCPKYTFKIEDLPEEQPKPTSSPEQPPAPVEEGKPRRRGRKVIKNGENT